MKFYSFLLLFITTNISFAQYAIDEIPTDLLKKVNAVVRSSETAVILEDYNDMTVSKKEVISVLNKRGLEVMQTYIHYDKSANLKQVTLRIFDANGNEVKTYKKRHFTDVSASGGSLYTDFRVLHFNYVPSSYPFTYEFITEYSTSSTALMPYWTPVEFSSVGVEKASYTILNENEVPIHFKSQNLEKFNVKKTETLQKYHFEVANIAPFKLEVLSPSIYQFVPTVRVSLEKFQLRNTPGYARNWKELGVWQNQALLRGRDAISQSTKAKIDHLVADVDDPKEKARRIYKYMQDKTRYISVQVGIGGWQPSLAQEVDELSYGDCKGLSNYTMALLKSQGIDSYYTLVNAGNEQFSTEEDFTALWFNHAILAVPFEDELVFLECTSQTTPFNYMGDFTDNRNVLMMTPEGGEIVKTHYYGAEDNIQKTKVSAVIDTDFKITGAFQQTSEGVLYGNRYWLESATQDEVEMGYKVMWGHLNNLSLGAINFKNDKKQIVFTESLNFETNNYVSTAGDRVLLNPNLLNRYGKIYSIDKNRILPLEIKRGKTYSDEIEILLPKGYTVEAAFDPIEITSKFGSYSAKLEQVNASKIKYTRKFILPSGTYPAEEFNDFANFIRKVVKKDKSKIVLSKT